MNKTKKSFNSRFGYIMVAAGAAIGLGNIWKFPYMVYGGGGGIFIILTIIFCVLLGKPCVAMESAVGRYARCNVIDAYGIINKKWRFVGIINVLCTTMIDMYYIIVSGYVLKYAIAFLLGGNFGENKLTYYNNFISDPVQPLFYAGIFLLLIVIMLIKGITETVEKITKIIMPLLTLLLIICALWAFFTFDGAVDGLKFYLIPDFSKLTLKNISDACVQVMFSTGIGWAIFSTLGASMQDTSNLKKDASMVVICDTAIAILAGFVIIPSVIGSGSEMVAGPSLVFLAMTDIFGALWGGNILGFIFFMALIFAVLSTCFTTLEIPAKCVEEKFHLSHTKATIITAIIIFAGGVLCSLSQGDGILSGIGLPWWAFDTGITYYNIYDWFDCMTGYVLLPLGCFFTSIYCTRVWGMDSLEKEVTKNGRDGKLSMCIRITMSICVPVLTLLVLLNVFGFIR